MASIMPYLQTYMHGMSCMVLKTTASPRLLLNNGAEIICVEHGLSQGAGYGVHRLT